MKKQQQLIEEVLRLDGERTQGEWRHNHGIIRPSDGTIHSSDYVHADGVEIASWFSFSKSEEPSAFNRGNAAFIALAPQVASLICDLKAHLDMAVDALEYESQRDDYGISDESYETLAKIKGKCQ